MSISPPPPSDQPQSADRSRGGRPRSDAKREAILGAARRLFLDHPFDRVSMDALAQAAGVSKVTIYAHFTSKEDVFVAALSSGTDIVFGGAAQPAATAAELEATLAAFGAEFVLMITTPDVHALHTVMMTEGRRHPALPQRFYETVVRRCTDELGAALADATARGLIACPDPMLAAMQFIALSQGEFFYRLQLGAPPPQEAEVRAYAAAAAALFLRGYRA